MEAHGCILTKTVSFLWTFAWSLRLSCKYILQVNSSILSRSIVGVDYQLLIDGAIFEDNAASFIGGAIAVSSVNIKMGNSSFTRNKISMQNTSNVTAGGAIYAEVMLCGMLARFSQFQAGDICIFRCALKCTWSTIIYESFVCVWIVYWTRRWHSVKLILTLWLIRLPDSRVFFYVKCLVDVRSIKFCILKQ